jgi:hypothetical protein
MEIRKIVVPAIRKGAPVIDGDLSDVVWKKAVRIKDFRKLGELKTLVTQQTEAGFVYDSKNLYMSFTCYASAPEKIVKASTERDSNIWSDDIMEIFLAVFPNARSKSWHLALTAGNTQWDSLLAPRQSMKWQQFHLKSWDSKKHQQVKNGL